MSSDVLNLQCWLATIPSPILDPRGVRVNQSDISLSIIDFMASVAALTMNVSCVDCSGPKFPELTDLLSSTEGSDAVTEVANRIFDLFPKLVEGNFFQLAIDRALNEANMRCPHSPAYDPNFSGLKYEAFEVAKSETTVPFFIGLLIVGAVLLVITLSIVLTTKFVVLRRHRKWINSLPTNHLKLLWQEQHKQDDQNNLINESTGSMFRSDAIPRWVRWTMPIIILGNIAFFLSGHVSLAASVTIIASLGGQTFSEEGFFEFSVAKSTIEIWNGAFNSVFCC
jgi:hypothetical protein